MTAKKPPRKPIPSDVETAVLAKSARRCVLCFHLDSDLKEKIGQIAHLDGTPSNAAEDNLAFMCLPHHSLFDSTTSQHKNYTIPEVKAARSRLYDLTAEGKHLTPAAAQPYLQTEADKKILHDFLDVVPSNGAIEFLRNHSLGALFQWNRLKDIERFLERRTEQFRLGFRAHEDCKYGMRTLIELLGEQGVRHRARQEVGSHMKCNHLHGEDCESFHSAPPLGHPPGPADLRTPWTPYRPDAATTLVTRREPR
jgi:hypothetical protein